MRSKSDIDSVDRMIKVFGFSISHISLTNVFGGDLSRPPAGKNRFQLNWSCEKIFISYLAVQFRTTFLDP